MNEKTLLFLRQVYKEYYFRSSELVEFPDDIGSREFGYMPFGGGMVRHLSFRSSGEALAELLKQSPSSVYCSNAKYEFPARPIDEKGWIGAELIFDIDSTDVPTTCKRNHDLWYCEKCHHSGKLPKPPRCTKCGGPSVEFHGTCEDCMNAAKDHTARLISFLTNDFGVRPDDIRVYFSGNRGYHVHVYDDRFEPLDQQARAEIAEYVRGSALPLTQTLAATLRRRMPEGPQGAGWTRRVSGYVAEHNQNYEGTLQKLVSEAVASQRALVDAAVTTDIHRVFRLAGTLHGNTGMSKVRVKSLSGFDPQEDPVVLESGLVKLQVSFYPKFRLKHRDFGPYVSETVEVPTFAAISILTRGLGEVA